MTRRITSRPSRSSRNLTPICESLEGRRLMDADASTALAARPVSNAATPIDYNPPQIRHAYGVDQLTQDGTGQTIAIVDPYNDPNIQSDLAQFDVTYSLPVADLTTVYLDGSTASSTPPAGMPTTNSAYAGGTALDVEWAHAIAPGANILLVETYTSSASDMVTAAVYAANHGANQVSMSFIFGGDSPPVGQIDSAFSNTSVSFFSSSGDSGSAVDTPAESDHVVSVGGTSLVLNSDNTIQSETAWPNSGGGTSSPSMGNLYEPRPSFQNGFQAGSGRGVPDVSYDGDQNTGYYIITGGQTIGVAGTSACAPQWAGLAALVNQGRANNGLQPIGTGLAYGLNSALYALAGGTSYTNPKGDFRDITSGSNGNPATVGYDTVTGLGSPVASKLVPDLIAYGATGTIAPTVGDSGFENPVNNSNNGPFGFAYNPRYAYYPAVTYWYFSGTAGVSHNNTNITEGNNAPGGEQVGFVQNQGMISEPVPNLAAGSYTLSFLAAQQANYGTALETFQVLVDGNVVGTITPSSRLYQTYTTAPFTVVAGTHTIAFQGVLPPSNSIAVIDNVSLAVAPPPTGRGGPGNGSPSVSVRNSTSGNPNAPGGPQVGLAQNQGTISRPVPNFAAGSNTPSLPAPQDNHVASPGVLQMVVDGKVAGTTTPSGTSDRTTASRRPQDVRTNRPVVSISAAYIQKPFIEFSS